MQLAAPVPGPTSADCGRQLAKVLASSEFAGARQQQEFLSYAASAAFADRKHLDQAEIARHVLNRGDDFNPIDDASVRKLAMLTRRRLERYYSGSGASDDLLIVLPTRSYVPTFVKRSAEEHPEEGLDDAEAEIDATEATLVPATKFGIRSFWAVLLLLAGASVGAACVWLVLDFRERSLDSDRPSFRFQTAYGDFMHRGDDLSRDIIHVGPPIGPSDEVTVRMRFRPERALHQAGLLILDSSNHYVKLGRQFESRPQMEFGIEIDGVYRKTANTFSYDRFAQTDEPRWLSIRREGEQFRAFTSSDGVLWQPEGEVLTNTKSMRNPRIAVFASNGRTAAPSIEASFDQLSYGLAFHNRPDGPLDLTQVPGWHIDSACREPMVDSGWLSFPSQEEAACRTAFLHSVPKGDWTLSALVDCLPVDGNIAALVVRGSKGEVRLIRWDISGAAVTLEHLQHGQSTLPDFPGGPPLILRLECRNGVLRGSFSRDDKEYFTLPGSVRMSEIGPDAQVGIQAGRSTWTKHETQAPRMSWIRFSVSDLAAFR